MKLFLCIIFCVLGTIEKTIAQVDTTKNKELVGIFFFMPIEFPIIDNSSINKQLTSAGYPSIDYPKANFGAGWQWYYKCSMINISYNLSTKERKFDSYLAEVAYTAISLNYGYDLIKNSEKFLLYPYLGFKFNAINYRYLETIPDETNMEDYLQTDLKYKDIHNSRTHLDLGIGTSYAHRWSGTVIGCRFGYLLPIQRFHWNVNDNNTELINSPKLSYGYYFTLILGMGAKRW